MSKQINALKLALDALRMPSNYWNKTQFIKVKEAIAAAEEALAQPEHEPVAFICQGNVYMADDVDEYCTATHILLYTKEQL